MRVVVHVIAGAEEDPLFAFHKGTMVYADPQAENSHGHLLDVAAALKAALVEATEAIDQQVDRFASNAG